MRVLECMVQDIPLKIMFLTGHPVPCIVSSVHPGAHGPHLPAEQGSRQARLPARRRWSVPRAESMEWGLTSRGNALAPPLPPVCFIYTKKGLPSMRAALDMLPIEQEIYRRRSDTLPTPARMKRSGPPPLISPSNDFVIHLPFTSSEKSQLAEPMLATASTYTPAPLSR